MSEGVLPFVIACSFTCLVVGLLSDKIYAIRFARKPALSFNFMGIIDNTRLLRVGLIRWDEVEEIFPCFPVTREA